MTSIILKRKTYVLLFSILLLGFVLRAHNYTTWPRLGATFDEFAWTWLGISLIQEQVPSAWSNYEVHAEHRQYKEYLGAKFWMITPYLEHPPLFGIAAGSFAIANGATGMFDVTLDKIRPLALILGVLSIASLFLLVKELYDEKTALLSALIYTIIPTVVIGSRLIQNENFFIPLYLFSLFLTFKFIKTRDNKYFFITAVICGLLLLAKIPWIAAGVGVGLILLYHRKHKYILFLIGIVLSLFSLFLVYGAYFNWDLFINVWRFQMERYEMSFDSIFSLFSQPYLADRLMTDGWIYFGWFAFILVLINDFKKNYFLILGMLGYFLVYIFAIPDTPGHGWYRYPFYPFLAISIALFIKEYFNKNTILTFFFILLIGLSLLDLSFKAQFGFSFKFLRLYLLATLITLIPLFLKNKKLHRFSYRFNNLMLVLLFSLSVWSVLEYNEQ